MPPHASATRPVVGICQWFHYGDYHAVRRCVDLMRELGAVHLRSGISWADFHRPGGEDWYQWQMEQLAEFEILLSIWHTPPSRAEGGVCTGPPRRLQDYADFVWQAVELYGKHFRHVELWNEPNNKYKWDFEGFDPQWRKFGEMIRLAGGAAHSQGMSTVLGGMMPVDRAWLALMRDYGALEQIDMIAIHGFPEMWWPDRPNWEWKDHWHGWRQKVDSLADIAAEVPIWITETGLATWDHQNHGEGRLQLQSEMLHQAIRAPVDRVYWYSLVDLDPRREAIEGFHVDENEYHLGLVRHDGSRKPSWQAMVDVLQASQP